MFESKWPGYILQNTQLRIKQRLTFRSFEKRKDLKYSIYQTFEVFMLPRIDNSINLNMISIINIFLPIIILQIKAVCRIGSINNNYKCKYIFSKVISNQN